MAQGSGAEMQKINRTTSAPLAAAFFVLSLAIMPFSLKVVRLTISLNPSLSAVVQVWNQIAGSFGSEYQPPTAAELIAIRNLNSNGAPDAVIEPANGSSLLAKLNQAELGEMYQPQFSDVEVEEFPASTPQAKSLKPASHPAGSIKRAGADSYYMHVQARIESHTEALRAAEVAQREIAAHTESLKGLDKQLAAVKFDFGKVLKNLHFNREVRVFMRVKPVKPVVPKLTACDLRAALMGGKNSETPQREERADIVESSATSFEDHPSFDNCEL
jgi:hypothetical protein